MEKTESKIFLTGIKPTGSPHIGNWLGAIRPALEAAASFEARYFIADYHALNSVKDPAALRRNTYEVAAAWMACGLDPQKTLFYRQSDIPQVFELATLLSAFTPKGLMNRAHAYKAAVAVNLGKGEDPDSGVNMGLYTYPVLMAADMTQTVTGLDGRKMSKSYNNTIPLFVGEAQLKKTVMRIVTNSQSVDEPKDPDSCSVFALYKLFASPEEQDALAQRYRAGGMGWGDAKKTLFEKMQNSSFLKGDNRRGWKATFDWLISNGENWRKVLEGNYDNEFLSNNGSCYDTGRNRTAECKVSSRKPGECSEKSVRIPTETDYPSTL